MGYTDFHAHLAGTEEARTRLLNAMNESGIDSAIVVAGGVISPHRLSRNFAYGGGLNVSIDNEAIFDQCAQADGRLFPFYFANPYDGAEDYRESGGRYYGLKLAPVVHGIAFSDPRIKALFSQAQAFQHSVYVHCLPRAGFQVDDLALAAEEFPLLSLVLGHAGIGHCDYQGVDRIAPLPNVFLETSGAFSGLVRYAMEKLGERRILFGTEFPLQDPGVEIAKAKAVGITAELSTQNAARLVRLGERHG